MTLMVRATAPAQSSEADRQSDAGPRPVDEFPTGKYV